MPRGASPTVLFLAAVATMARPALGSGPPVVVTALPGADQGVVKRVREVVASRRSVREDLALPPPDAVSTERAAMTERTASIRLALERARRAESEASWDACVREASGALSDALEVLAKVDDLQLLRDLRVQIGACLTLAQSAPNARPHFVSAALLDESTPQPGLHREEAERAQLDALAEVVARARGRVRIETAPPGAEVWIDGRKAPGTTPLEVDVRLGDHFVTVRRFRFEPHTVLTPLQPQSAVRMVLDPAQRATLREQLAGVLGGRDAPSEEEMRLARAVWSRAEQVVTIAPAGGYAAATSKGAARITVLDALTGQSLRGAPIAAGSDDDAIRRGVCDALGETCEPRARAVPWYVWPIAGVAVVGGVISTAFLVNANRQYTFVACPAGKRC
jgi:hypothetical protein